MEYIYAALLLHSGGKKIDEKGLTSVLKSAGIEVETARVKALVSSLEGVNIKELLSAPALAPLAQAQAAPAEKKKEEKKKEEEKKAGEEEAAEGLGALFG